MIYVSLILTGLLVAASVIDLTQFRIPNAISLGIVGLFLIKLGAEAGTLPLLSHLVLASCMLVLGFFAFVARVLGGGDAKLIAALALWFGPAYFLDFITIMAIAGGVLALFLMLLRRPALVQARHGSPNPTSSPHPLLQPDKPIPYALPIAFAALWQIWL